MANATARRISAAAIGSMHRQMRCSMGIETTDIGAANVGTVISCANGTRLSSSFLFPWFSVCCLRSLFSLSSLLICLCETFC